MCYNMGKRAKVLSTGIWKKDGIPTQSCFPTVRKHFALLDGLQILVQLWHGDEAFPARLRCLWDENTTRYIRYETTWYAVGLLMDRIKEKME